MGNFDNFTHIPSQQFFNHFNSNYNNESLMIELLTTEAFNQHGVSADYYVISYDTKYDQLFGEDNNRRLVRKFGFMSYFELPEETKSFSTMGIGWTNIFHIYISKRHFIAASSYDNNKNLVYPAYEPRCGDILGTSYNGVFYEIISVKSEEQQMLQRKHSWDVIVRVIRDKSFSTSPETSATMPDLLKYNNKSDLFDIGKFIKETTQPNTNTHDINYNPSTTECPPADPFNDWTSK